MQLVCNGKIRAGPAQDYTRACQRTAQGTSHKFRTRKKHQIHNERDKLET